MNKKITSDELNVFLRKHKLWLVYDPDGQKANLCGANLLEADLRGANLQWANLREADLRGVDLREADLRGVDLRGADLYGADLRGANLQWANLWEADLCGANLQWADLRNANLYGADLREADLRGVDLRGADLREAKNVNYPIACPEKGSFTGFKKANGHIIEMLIPDDALRSSATTRKCRCSKAKVMAITKLDGSSCNITRIPSNWNRDFIYTIGETVEVNNFDTNRWNECAPGIHFFITRQEAIDY